MVARIIGRRVWGSTRTEEGHREYKLTLRIETTSPLDGPAIVRQCPGIPVPGSLWILGNDVDLFAWCHLNDELKAVLDVEPNTQWDYTFNFSTKPLGKGGDVKGCNGQQIEDPLLIPPRVSGNSTRYTEEATVNRFNKPITNYAMEPITGPEVEFDWNRGQIVIEQNVLSLQENLCESMRDKVNASTLWGHPPRCVKLSDFRFDRKYYGTCYLYFTRTFTFDVRYPSNIEKTGGLQGGFDKYILSRGNMVIRGRWYNMESDKGNANYGNYVPAPDLINSLNDPKTYQKAANFQVFQDFLGNYATTTHTRQALPIGANLPSGGQPLKEAYTIIEKYDEADFLQLGIPSVIDQYS